MKIAVIVSGMYREFETASKSWSFLNWPEVDVYFSTWSDTNETNPRIHINVAEDVSYERIAEHTPNLVRVSLEPQAAFIHHSGQNKMIHRWKRGLAMVNFSNVVYDAVILIRPDLMLEYDEDGFKQFLEKIEPNTFYVPALFDKLYNTDCLVDINTGVTLPGSGINDQMFVGTHETINVLMSMNTPLKEENRCHHRLFEHLDNNKMKMALIEHCRLRTTITRHTSRGQTNFQKVFDDARGWYHWKLGDKRKKWIANIPKDFRWQDFPD